jgi:hypothetical protein
MTSKGMFPCKYCDMLFPNYRALKGKSFIMAANVGVICDARLYGIIEGRKEENWAKLIPCKCSIPGIGGNAGSIPLGEFCS